MKKYSARYVQWFYLRTLLVQSANAEGGVNYLYI